MIKQQYLPRSEFCHICSLQNNQNLFFSQQAELSFFSSNFPMSSHLIQNKFPSLIIAYKSLHSLALFISLDLFPSTLILPSAPLLCCSWTAPSTLPSHGLCNCFSLCLGDYVHSCLHIYLFIDRHILLYPPHVSFCSNITLKERPSLTTLIRAAHPSIFCPYFFTLLISPNSTSEH